MNAGHSSRDANSTRDFAGMVPSFPEDPSV